MFSSRTLRAESAPFLLAKEAACTQYCVFPALIFDFDDAVVFCAAFEEALFFCVLAFGVVLFVADVLGAEDGFFTAVLRGSEGARADTFGISLVLSSFRSAEDARAVCRTVSIDLALVSFFGVTVSDEGAFSVRSSFKSMRVEPSLSLFVSCDFSMPYTVAFCANTVMSPIRVMFCSELCALLSAVMGERSEFDVSAGKSLFAVSL